MSKKVTYLIKSAQSPEVDADASDILINREATSVRQFSEWGMRGLQGSFPRLKDTLAYEERGERSTILELIVHVYNVRSTLVGINQILNSYMPSLDKSCDESFKRI